MRGLIALCHVWFSAAMVCNTAFVRMTLFSGFGGEYLFFDDDGVVSDCSLVMGRIGVVAR